MVKKDVEIGGVYRMKVSNKITTVRIDRESRYGGWEATNVATKRQVRVRTAGKLRSKVTGAPELAVAKGPTAKRYTRATREALASNGMSTERMTRTEAVIVAALNRGRDADGISLADALDKTIMYLGDFIYNGAESGMRTEVDQCIGRLAAFLHDHK